MPVAAKICGLSAPETVRAAVDGGAGFVGFVFFAPSPRNLSPLRASELAAPAREAGVRVVAVTVDASDDLLGEVSSTLSPDLVQLHGAETPERADAVRRLTGAEVIKVIRVSAPADLDAATAFEGAVDHLMFDAKPPKGATLPGGNGAAFDWSMLQGRRFATPWFLAGGLDAQNVAEAVRGSGAPMVDVSSGVESAPGVKDPVLVKAFLEAVRRA